MTHTEFWVEVPHDPENWRESESECVAEFPGTNEGLTEATLFARDYGQHAYVVEAFFEYSDCRPVRTPGNCGSDRP